MLEAVTWHTGGKAEFLIAAKDVKGVRKSLGGDVFTVSWTRAGQKEPPMTGLVWTCSHPACSCLVTAQELCAPEHTRLPSPVHLECRQHSFQPRLLASAVSGNRGD